MTYGLETEQSYSYSWAAYTVQL